MPKNANKPKILFLADQLDLPETRLAIELHRRKYKLEVVLSANSEKSAIFSEAGIPTHTIKIHHRFDLRAAQKIRQIINRSKISLVHCFSAKALSVALIAIRRLKQIKLTAYRGVVGGLSRLDPAARLSFLHPRISGIIAVAEAVRESLIALKVPSAKIKTVYKGHCAEWYLPSYAREIWSAFGINRNTLIIQCTANVRANKGIDLLIEAVHNQPQLSLVLVGTLSQKNLIKKIKRANQRLKNIFHLGYREDAAKLAGAADVITLTSRKKEGLPKSIIEGMVQGVPAVVTAVGGMRELVENNISGIVVEENTSSKLREIFLKLACDDELRKRLGNEARQRILSKFSFEETVIQTELFFERILNDNR
ncbi:MAG TPA: glycosyltransferase [Oligoflexia bacterium]|nr:glycosyltransferase [Oligoflexia bacterium]HMP27809.1 glycosyltransferase [Oligoflexia bacterium]